MEKLLPELLEIIFSFLRPKDIENAANVCRGWREIITSSTPLMKRLTLSVILRDNLEENFFKLPYRNIELNGLTFNYLDRVQSNIRKVFQTVDRGQVEKLHIYLRLGHLPSADFLIGMSNLTTLVVEQLPGHISGDVKLPNLTHLKLMDSGLALLLNIKSHKVKFLHLSCREYGWMKMYSSGLVIFLMTCGELKHLFFDGYTSLPTSELSFQLESLTMLNIDIPSNNFKAFLESQKASLKYLQLDAYSIDDEASDFIYYEMDLEKLIDCRKERGEMTQQKDVKIKNLAINYEREDFAFVQGLLPYCHDLEVLSISLLEGMELELLHLISQLPKLKHLKLRGWSSYDRIEINLEFPQLEELILVDVHVISFAHGCPKLKCLKITKDSTLSTSDFESIFKSCPDIEKVDLGIFNHLTEKMLEVLKFAGSKIKLKCRVTHEDDYEKLMQLKNRLIANFVDINPCEDDTDLFSFEPKILTELYGYIDECNEINSTCSLSWMYY